VILVVFQMQEFRIDGWNLICDPGRTREAYFHSARGAHCCPCSGCRNFLAVRDDYYPSSLLGLLDSLGINKHKEAEVYEMGPKGKGRLYGGWYHFIGRVVEDPGRTTVFIAEQPKSAAWEIRFLQKRDLAFETFETPELVQLEFVVELPWRLKSLPNT
jgi:hypothetical protein